MTQKEFSFFEKTVIAINEYYDLVIALRAIIEGRKMLAEGLLKKEPNMKTTAIFTTLSEQETKLLRDVQVCFDTAQMYAAELGYTLENRTKTLEDFFPMLRKPLYSWSNLIKYITTYKTEHNLLK